MPEILVVLVLPPLYGSGHFSNSHMRNGFVTLVAGKKQVLIDRINRMLEVYTQQLDEDEAAEEEAEQVSDEGYEADVGDDEDIEEESFIRASQNDDLMGDLEGESRYLQITSQSCIWGSAFGK